LWKNRPGNWDLRVDEIGDITYGIAPPVTSDRCTVFMEQDLRALLKEGFTKEEALASVLYSVIRNYLTRVKGNRWVSDKTIFFQGATARNRGLVAALENLLDVEVKVSPFCHLMGGIGAALMAQEYCSQYLPQQTHFRVPGPAGHSTYTFLHGPRYANYAKTSVESIISPGAPAPNFPGDTSAAGTRKKKTAERSLNTVSSNRGNRPFIFI